MQQEFLLGPPILPKGNGLWVTGFTEPVFLRVYNAARSTGHHFHGTSAIWLSSVRLCSSFWATSVTSRKGQECFWVVCSLTEEGMRLDKPAEIWLLLCRRSREVGGSINQTVMEGIMKKDYWEEAFSAERGINLRWKWSQRRTNRRPAEMTGSAGRYISVVWSRVLKYLHDFRSKPFQQVQLVKIFLNQA